MRKVEIITFSIILLSFSIAFILYQSMPERMASHWNINGAVDSYASKEVGLFLMPFITIVLFAFLEFIPVIDPLRKNIEKFRKHFDIFIIFIMAFLFYIYILTILWNLGLRFSIIYALSPAFSALFYYCGILIENAKRNWFIGIRTPWTLSSDRVWDKTHKLGAKLFKACGIISLLGLIFQGVAFWLVIIPVIGVAIYLFVYSYFEFNKGKGRKRK